MQGNDKRVLAAAAEIMAKGLAEVSILGKPDEVEAEARRLGLDLSACKIIDHTVRVPPHLSPCRPPFFHHMFHGWLTNHSHHSSTQSSCRPMPTITYRLMQAAPMAPCVLPSSHFWLIAGTFQQIPHRLDGHLLLLRSRGLTSPHDFWQVADQPCAFALCCILSQDYRRSGCLQIMVPCSIDLDLTDSHIEI